MASPLSPVPSAGGPIDDPHPEILAKMFAPVKESLDERGDAKCVWISLDPYYLWDAGAELKDLGIEPYNFGGQVFRSRFIDHPLPLMYWRLLTEIRPQIFDFFKYSLIFLIISNTQSEPPA